MASLERQIASLFEDVDSDLQNLVIRVLEIEKEFLHLERPHGIMEKIDSALDVVAQESLKNETR